MNLIYYNARMLAIRVYAVPAYRCDLLIGARLHIIVFACWRAITYSGRGTAKPNVLDVLQV